MGANKRVWIYCRLSHPDMDALERQKQERINAAQECGFEIVGITAEIAPDLSLRQHGMEEVFAAADAGLMDAVFTGNSNRITRDNSVLSDFIHRLDKKGVELLVSNAQITLRNEDIEFTWAGQAMG